MAVLTEGKPIKILVVEDAERLAEMIVGALIKSGYQAEAVYTATDAQSKIIDEAFDAMILDLGLPDMDGLELMRSLRSDGAVLPIIILTTRIMLADRVSGLNAGADDYVTKPFEMEELVARLRAVLRRPTTGAAETLTLGNLSFDTNLREVRVGGAIASFAPKELLLLEQLIRHQKNVVSKIFLEDNIYGADTRGATNSLEVLTHRLRARLKEIGARVAVHTVRGVGYMIAEEDVAA